MESYLLGVVAGEIGRLPETRVEAVKAQAIAARTYALSSLGQYGPDAGFDLHASTLDQVYEGILGEDPTGDVAVLATVGLVLEYRDKLTRSYYHATCGGRTAPVDEVWTDRPHADYLKGVADRSMRIGGAYPLCSGSPNFNWTENWDGRALERILERSIPRELELPLGSTGFGHVKEITISHRGPSGRVHDFEIVTTTQTFHVPQDKVRSVLRRPVEGEPPLRSTLIRVEKIEKTAGRVSRLIIAGRGNGHGVGMCQSGAIGMAEGGAVARDILSHYYPGTHVRHYSEIRNLPAVAVSAAQRTAALAAPGRPGASEIEESGITRR
jgi:stage II sporulation protein D